MITPLDYLYALASVTTVFLSGARLIRLWTHDDFPPVKALRNWMFDFMAKRKWLRNWTPLTYCPYCVSFWIVLLLFGWGMLADWNTVWWLINGSLGVSYLSAILVVNDGDNDDEDDD